MYSIDEKFNYSVAGSVTDQFAVETCMHRNGRYWTDVVENKGTRSNQPKNGDKLGR